MSTLTHVFKPDPIEVRHARAMVVSILHDADLPTDLAELVVSELATNAVIHGRTDFRLEVDRMGDRIRIACFDAGGGWPCRRPPAGDSVTGRGLRIVDHLADRWGVIWTDPGKVVWAELELPAAVLTA
jgi:anti-sigma regulatory factor (Ser/Thr protein kinase)